MLKDRNIPNYILTLGDPEEVAKAASHPTVAYYSQNFYVCLPEGFFQINDLEEGLIMTYELHYILHMHFQPQCKKFFNFIGVLSGEKIKLNNAQTQLLRIVK